MEILGFTSTNVQEYVERFSQDFTGAKEKIWKHIVQRKSLFIVLHPSELFSRLPLPASNLPVRFFPAAPGKNNGHLPNLRKDGLLQTQQGKLVVRGTRKVEENAHV